MGLLYTRYVL